MQTITSALQLEASQIRSILQKQADDLSADLSRAEKQFTTLGEALKQRTDAAYALLDRVAEHYNDVTRTAAQDIETLAERLEQVTGQSQGKVEALSATLTQQLSIIGNGSTQLEAQGQSTDHCLRQNSSASLRRQCDVDHHARSLQQQRAADHVSP